MPIIEVKNLVKKFPQPGGGELMAVADISFTIEPGEIFGLVGPNGAGKTTTLEIIEGLQKPSGGNTIVLGFDSQHEVAKVKERIGIQLQSSSFFDYLNLMEILKLYGGFYPKQSDPEELLRIVELSEKRKSLVKQLSGGQQQRFSIAVSLVNEPEVVFLDEPTTGLDPQARRHMWDFIRKINERGKTIVLTTHYMEEAETLCDRVGIIDHGKIVALDTPDNLINHLEATAHLSFQTEKEMDPYELGKITGVLASEKNGEGIYRLKITNASEVLPPLFRWSHEQNNRLNNIEISRANLEDVFLALTGSRIRE
ncbi:MAG: ABC transporter ATP-binding protein [Patescibacteria group bacterium]|nr:ABC transporter ATP-binding protein [Patescibacteria group bacterium]